MIAYEKLIRVQPGEKVIFAMRMHWIIFLGDLAMIALLAIVPYGVLRVVMDTWTSLLAGPITRPILVLIGSAYYLMLWLFFITRFIDHHLDIYLVTSHRILDVAQNGMFSRTVSELDLSRVQDVTSEVKGVLHTMLNYGNVHIQTASEKERFVFEDVTDPDSIRKQLLELVETDVRRNDVVRPPAV